MSELTLMQKFADPALMHQLSTLDKTTGALVTTMMGMGITFVVLSLLWAMIALMTKILDRAEGKPTAEISQVKGENTIPSVEQHEQTSTTSPDDDLELIAVITAALAASLNQPANSLIINKIRRVTGRSIAWSQAGSSDSIASRKF